MHFWSQEERLAALLEVIDEASDLFLLEFLHYANLYLLSPKNASVEVDLAKSPLFPAALLSLEGSDLDLKVSYIYLQYESLYMISLLSQSK